MANPVFLSYRHEGDPHRIRVRGLAERLERVGVQVVLDQFAQEREFNYGGPDRGWPHWSVGQAENPQHKVLIIASAGWFRCYEGKEQPGLGLGAAAEGGVIRQRLYNGAGSNPDIRIVAFDHLDALILPLNLQPYHRFADPAEFSDIAAWLTGSSSAQTASTASDWPIDPQALAWPVANHGSVRIAFESLLTRGAQGRCLLLSGATETGKSHLTRLMLRNALQHAQLACGRFDFKGGTDRDTELRSFVQALDMPLPAATGSLNERLSRIFEYLKYRARPTLLIFDTYEMAGEAEAWVENLVLPALIRAAWLRVVIAGQKVPRSTGSVWESQACEVLQLVSPPAEDWFAFSRPHKPTATLELVREVHVLCGGKASLLAQILGPT